MWLNPRNSSTRTGGTVGSQRGFALLLVIWVISLLTVMATMLLSDTRNEELLVRNNLQSARASALAEAGVTLAITSLLDPNPATRWTADGQPHPWSYGGADIMVTMVDENGKIDLNLSPLELLGDLFAMRGIDGDMRQQLLAEIDRRRKATAQLTPQVFGGIRIPIIGAQPRNAFYSVDDLRGIPGLSRAAFESIRPFLTVHSQTGRINPLTASREVLLSIPGIDPLEIEALLAARTSFGNVVNPAALPPLTGGQAYTGFAGSGGAATITATATLLGGTSFTREAVVSLTDTPLQPYRILEWRQPIDAAYASIAVQ